MTVIDECYLCIDHVVCIPDNAAINTNAAIFDPLSDGGTCLSVCVCMSHIAREDPHGYTDRGRIQEELLH